MAMTIYVTKQQYLRWRHHLRISNKLHNGLAKSDTTPFHINRDPHDVRVILKSIQRYGYRWFWFKNIRKYFADCDDGVGLKRNTAVNVMQALEADGFIRIHRNYNSHLSRYEVLFSFDDIDSVYEKVVNK